MNFVNNNGGKDTDSYFVGLHMVGDDVRLTLTRKSGKYTLTTENITAGSANTITIRHPSFLDNERDLYVGIFGANTNSEIRRTLSFKDVKVTVWTQTGNNNVAAQ